MSYLAEYTRPYPNGYVNLPSESTPEMAEFLNARDDVLIKIEQYLANLNSEYALLTEAGYDLFVGLDSNYVLTINLQNKNGKNISHKTVDLPIESMIIDVDYVDGKLVLTLQNGNTVDVDVSDMVRGLVPTTRKIAGIDLADDITKEELVEALDISSGGGASGDIPTKVSQLENDLGYVTQEDIIGAETVSAGEIKPWLYKSEEEVIIGVYDEKPLYRKCLQVNGITGTTGSINISDFDETYNIVSVDGVARLLGSIIPFNTDWDNGYRASIYISENAIQWNMGNWGVDTTMIFDISIEYTKTTDAEGSGNDLKPYGIYDAKLDDIKAEIDEVKNAITETTETTMPNSHDGRLLIEEIGGVCEQGENPSPTSPQEIKNSVVSGVKTHGTQLFDVSTTTIGSIDTLGNATSNDTNRASDFIASNGSVVVSVNQKIAVIGVAFYDRNKSFISRTYVETKNVLYSNVVENCAYIRAWFAVDGSILSADRLSTYNPMINEGTETLPYEPYKESTITLSQPIELYGIGDVQDVIEDGKVKRRFDILKVTTETNITQHQLTNNDFMVVTLRRSDLLGNRSGMCTHLPALSSSFLTKQPSALFEGYGNITISLPKTLTPNLASAKQWLIDNDVTFVKGLAETITEALPTADQIALNSLATFNGITYLEFGSEIEPTFEGEYGTSKHGGYTLESLLTARNNDLRLSSLEASVVNNI